MKDVTEFYRPPESNSPTWKSRCWKNFQPYSESVLYDLWKVAHTKAAPEDLLVSLWQIKRCSITLINQFLTDKRSTPPTFQPWIPDALLIWNCSVSTTSLWLDADISSVTVSFRNRISCWLISWIHSDHMTLNCKTQMVIWCSVTPDGS